VVGRITQRSTGCQKQERFLPVAKLLVKERYRFKRNSFFAFAACELNVIHNNFVCSILCSINPLQKIKI